MSDYFGKYYLTRGGDLKGECVVLSNDKVMCIFYKNLYAPALRYTLKEIRKRYKLERENKRE